MRGLLALLLLPALVAGCSSAAPLPPLAEPVSDGPKQYWWPALRLEPGTELTYRAQTFEETKSGDEVTTAVVDHVVRLTARPPTTQARGQVSVAVDGAEVVLLLFDEDGRLHDAVLVKPELPLLVRQLVWGLGITTRHFAAQTLTVGERRLLQLPWEQIRPLLALAPDERVEDLAATVPTSHGLRVEFVGYRRVAGRITTTLQGTVENFLTRKVKWVAGEGRIVDVDHLTVEWTEHLDATAGLPVSRYWVQTVGGEADGQRFTQRDIVLMVLERWTTPGREAPAAPPSDFGTPRSPGS